MSTVTKSVAVPNVINHVAEILACVVITTDPATGLLTIMNIGNAKGLNALEASTEPVKIEAAVETVSPVQTAINPPKRRGRGRPPKNAPAAAVAETPTPVAAVETAKPKRGRGRPPKNAPAAAVAETTTKPNEKGKRNSGMQTDIFKYSDFIGTLVHCADKGTRTPVYIVEVKEKGCKVASPQKDQSGVAVGFVKCAVWFSVNAKQDRRSDSMDIAALFEE